MTGSNRAAQTKTDRVDRNRPKGSGTLKEIPKGSGRYQLRAYLGRDARGVTVHRTKTVTAANPTEADELLHAFMKEVTPQRKAMDRRAATVADLMDAYLRLKQDTRKPSTVKGYRSKVKLYILPRFGRTKLRDLRPEDIDLEYAQLGKKGLRPATVRQAHMVLSGALKQAHKWGGWPVADVVDRMTGPTVHAEKPKSIPRADANAVFDLAGRRGYEGDVRTTALRLAGQLGCRDGELCALRWSHVSSAESIVVTVQESVFKPKGEPAIVEDTKAHAQRPVPLGAKGFAIVERRRQVQIDQARTAGVELVADPYLLSQSVDGSEPALPDTVGQMFSRLVDVLWPRQRLELTEEDRKEGRKQGKWATPPRYHFHQLRHMVLSRIANEIDLPTAREMGGHANISTTSLYIEALPERLAEVGALFDADT